MKFRHVLGLIIIGIFLLGLYADYSLWIAEQFTEGRANDVTKAGSWGDTFGPFSALISAAGFVAVIVTLQIQRQAIKEQAADLHRQRFESSFFELLKLMRELRGEIEFTHSYDFIASKAPRSGPIAALTHAREYWGGDRHNTEAVDAAVQEIHFWLTQSRVATNTSQDDLVNAYMWKVHSKSEATLGPYFRIIYTLLKRLKNDKVLTNAEKISYGNLLRSQLTSHETILLAINGLSPIANDFSSLITEYRMLKYLTAMAWKERLLLHYDAVAFKERS